MWVGSLGWEDPIEEGIATQSSILAWRTPWTEEPSRLWFTGSQGVRDACTQGWPASSDQPQEGDWIHQSVKALSTTP